MILERESSIRIARAGSCQAFPRSLTRERAGRMFRGEDRLQSKPSYGIVPAQIPTTSSRRVTVAHFLTQVAYTPEAWASLVQHPQARSEQVRPAVEKLGGKVISGYLTFGEYDLILITEFPSSIDVAALAIAAAAGGSIRAIKTTPLLTQDEGMEAIKKAKSSGYRAVGAGS
jgi:uncharacterized protein with GYD domain